MLKKTLLATIIITATSTTALAGGYIGGSIGAADLSAHHNGQIHSGGIAKVFAGNGDIYGKHNNLYLGTEVNGDTAHYTKYSRAIYGLGASLIPGILVTETVMVFGRVGVEAQRIRGNSSTHVGNQLGAGIQTELSSAWDARMEYVRTSQLGGHSQANLGLVYKF